MSRACPPVLQFAGVLLLGLAALLLPGSAGAQAPAPAAPLVLTPAQAGELAAQQALEVALAQENVTQAEAGVAQAETGRHLTAGLTGAVGRMGPVRSVQIGEGPPTQIGSPNIQQVTLSVTQPVYDGHRLDSRVAAARAGVAAATEQAEATRRSMRLTAEQTAYGILRATELAQVSQRQVDANREHLRLAQVMFDAGTVAKFEVTQARTALSSSEGDLIAVQTGVEQAIAGLRRVLNLPQSAALQVVAPTEPLTSAAGELPALIEQAWSGRSEVRVAQAGVQRAEAGVRLARASLSLSAALTGQVMHQVSSALSGSDSWQVMLAVSQPLLDGGVKRAAVRQAESSLRSAQLGVESQQQQIALGVTQQYLSLQQATKQLQVATQGVVEALERARLAEVRFQAGVTTGIEVLDAQTALAAAEATQVNANYDLHLALLGLNYALGRSPEGEQ